MQNETNKSTTNYTYILECCDGSLYTGWTNDLKKRLKAHQSGKGAKYTSSHLPVTLVYYEIFSSKKEAMSREWHIKKLSRPQKKKLISDFDPDKLSVFLD
ncbi:MAG: GIY-YIG nuclease family protein [Lachnospiraceae bacterium]|nr:GIY-YIG nuclease family protein [Lachnospiraceae bacterium]